MTTYNTKVVERMASKAPLTDVEIQIAAMFKEYTVTYIAEQVRLRPNQVGWIIQKARQQGRL